MAAVVYTLNEGHFGELDKSLESRVSRAKTATGFARVRGRAAGLRRDRRWEAEVDGLIRDQRHGVVVALADADGSRRELYLVYEDRS